MMDVNIALADRKVDDGREKVREWGAKISKGEWDWHSLGHALQYAHEALERASTYQRPWTLLADIYHRIGKIELAKKCLKRSYGLATPGPRFPGGFYNEVDSNIRTGFPFNSLGGLKPSVPPVWFEEKYQRYWTIAEVVIEKNLVDITEVPTIFISYARENTIEAHRLYKDLRAHDFAVWIDTEELQPGERWKQKILDAIANNDFIVLCLSTLALSKTGFFQVELKEALEQQKFRPISQVYLIPVRLDDCELPFELREFHHVDLFQDWQNAVAKVTIAVHQQHKARRT